MATTVDSSSNYLQLDSLPIVDLNSLSQSELNSLSLCSDDAFDLRHCDDLVIPKIDRSVFNESAGSRKQTYSRLRLAPRQNEITSPGHSGRGAGIRVVHKNAVDDAERKENSEQIVNVLRGLLGLAERVDPAIDLTSVDRERRGRKRGRKRKDGGLGSGGGVLEISKSESPSFDISVLANVENVEDPYSPELRKRTVGLETAAELLGFLGRLEGRWASQRRKRKIVDASDFGDHLPKGWKLLLGLKRKQGRVWLYCRRYISSNGQQFASWKDVSSYLISFGSQNFHHLNPCHGDENGHEPYKISSGSISGLTPIGHTAEDPINCTASPEPVTLLNVGNSTDIEVLSTDASESQLNNTKVVNHEPECALGDIHSKSDMDLAIETDSRNGEKNEQGTSVPDASSLQVQSSSCFCSHDVVVGKEQDNFCNVNQKPGNISAVEELSWNDKELLKTSSAQPSRSLTEELMPPMDLANNIDMEEGIENSAQFDSEGIFYLNVQGQDNFCNVNQKPGNIAAEASWDDKQSPKISSAQASRSLTEEPMSPVDLANDIDMEEGIENSAQFDSEGIFYLSGQGQDCNVNQKPGNISAAEASWNDKESPKTSLAQASRSLPEEAMPMDLANNKDKEEGIENSAQFDSEGILTKMASMKQPTSVCIWCGVEFNLETVKPELRSDSSVGFLCPICKAKFSGQLNILEFGQWLGDKP